MEWKDALVGAAGFAIAAWVVYSRVKTAVALFRRFRSDRTGRVISYIVLATVATMIASCGTLQAIVRPPAGAPTPTAVTATSFALGLLVFAVLFVHFVKRPQREAVERFIANRRCPRCARALSATRVRHPANDRPGVDLSAYWFHTCECGALTTYKPDGSTVHVDVEAPGRRSPSPSA